MLASKKEQDGCTCEEWEKGMASLNTILTLSSITGRQKYTGTPFKYCPWCRRELIWKK
jgi:hypothetical protein